ncbi:dystrotelin [Ailuropoda melanoleuca]|uniref:Dystrotelin n=1 Tax=Ailuropoda melanoleuca TaxID=9646 RepID=A0A7N5KRH6_AILME|nr:dystrotelin [Ailuropoda melanoleuca]
MDPGKQDALNSIENSIYRTAFKLRSVQTLCQLDLMDSSLIQLVLLRHCSCEARESPLPVQQLFRALRELFQRVGEEKPGQVHPRASELTLSLLTTLYDSTGTGLLKLVPATAALIALSGDSPLTKYRALFQLYAEQNRGGYDSGARMTRSVLRNLLTDLQQIPAVVGESRALCSVESATRSCFQGVLSPTIKEEKFLSWLQSEPPILLWLPTSYRLSATEMVTHPVRCRICRSFPITGLRYRCLKCLNFDLCQECFFAGLHGRSPQKVHRCVQMSAKENTKCLVGTLRSTLLQGRSRRKETSRRQCLLDQGTPKEPANGAQARFLKKQFNQYKDKLQAIYASQEEKSCRFETKIHRLTASQDSLRTQLWQMGQYLQAVLQPPHPSASSCHNMISKGVHGKGERLGREGDSSQVTDATEDCSEWEPRADPTTVDRGHQSQANAEHPPPNSEPPEAVLQLMSTQSARAQSQAQKFSKEIFSSPPGSQEGPPQDTSQIVPAEVNSPALAPAEGKETLNIQERKDELKERELQKLLSKLADVFSLEMPSGPQPSVNMDLYCGAELVCKAFSALVDQITLSSLR